MSSSESEQAASTEEGRPSERPSKRASTIIVDPGLIEEAERFSESQRPPAMSASTASTASAASSAEDVAASSAEEAERARDSGESETDSEGENGAAHDHLSIEEAERFATAFRASWEPPAPAAHGKSASTPPRAASVRPVAEPIPARVLVSQLPGARRGRTLALAAAAFAGFVAIALLGWFASHSDGPAVDNPLAAAPLQAAPKSVDKAPERAAPEPRAAAPAEPIAIPEAAAPAEPIAAPEAVAEPEPVLVALQITTRPASAQLVLDGSPVGNPYDAMHPQGGSHVVEATAPGYRAQNLTIELSRQRSVALELEKAPAQAAAPPEPAARKPARAKRPRAPRPSKAAAPKKDVAFSSESPY